MQWSPAIPMGMPFEEGEGGKLDTRVEVSRTK